VVAASAGVTTTSLAANLPETGGGLSALTLILGSSLIAFGTVLFTVGRVRVRPVADGE
jgi:hypothetical protein